VTVLSDPSRTVPRVWHPWRTIRSRSDITVRWRRLDGRLGEWCEDTHTMTLDPRQLQRERRCTATHEAIHAERGDRCGDPKTEARVRRETARRLISIRALGDAYLFWGDDLASLAEELWVDEDVLRTRLDHLHPAERGYLQQRLAGRDGSA
jgi:hypothetical protein